jgi:phospholipid-binding lipoprotein MlaA
VLRDTAAMPIDFYGDVFSYTRPVYVRNTGEVIRLVDKRAGYLGSINLMQDAALDEYAFVRDAYLQRLSSLVESSKNLKKDREEEQEDMQRQNNGDEAKPAENGKDNDKGADQPPSSPNRP